MGGFGGFGGFGVESSVADSTRARPLEVHLPEYAAGAVHQDAAAIQVVRRDLARAQGSEFRVQGSGFRAQRSGFRVQGSGFRV